MSNSCFIRSLSAWVVKSICPVRSCAHQVPAEETAGKWIMLRWWAAVYLPVDSQSLFVCSAEWKKEKTALKHRGVYSIPLIKTNRNQNMSGCVLCQLMVLCVFRLQLKIWRTTSAWFDLLRTDWVLQWSLSDEEKVMQQRPLVSRLRITGEPNWSRNWWGDRWGSGVVWSDLTSSLVIQITTCITGTNRYKETYCICLKATSLKILLSSSDFLYIQY